jgi:hypothetical protein
MLLFLCLIAVVVATPCQVCWNFPAPSVNCSAPGPYIDGPFAFSTNNNKGLARGGGMVADIMRDFDPSHWLDTELVMKYHVPINYMYCLGKNYTSMVRDLLGQFRWKSFEVRFNRTCCATDGSWQAQLCVDGESQKILANFSRSVMVFLNNHGVPLEQHDAWQPPYHNTIGHVTEQYNMTGLFRVGAPPVDVVVKLDRFVFQDAVYYADDYVKSKSSDTALIVIVLLLLAFLVAMAVVQVRKARRDQEDAYHMQQDG